jgi:ADP-ribose pyrophosphatase YjhB (NUDIX family)
METFEFTTNPFGGVIIEAGGLPADPSSFRNRLRYSLDTWGAQGFRVAWIELDLGRAGLVPVAVDEGFQYHHSGEEYLMLTRRLVEDAFVPPYASHYIGAGGVVVNDTDELLVVHEKGRSSRGRYYKLPGGALQAGEHLVDAVVREVLEETGIETSFMSLACFRSQHGYRFGKSDIYFVCRLEPLTHEITLQEEEIEECLWMPIEDYYRAEDVSFFNKLIVCAALDSPGVVPTRIEGYRNPETVEVFLPRGTTEIFQGAGRG